MMHAGRALSAAFLVAACSFGLVPRLAAQARESGPASTGAPHTIRLSLQNATALAVRNNLTLRKALIDEQIAETLVRQQLAAFDPTFYSAANAGKQEQLFAGVFPDPNNPSVSSTVVVNTREDVANASLGLRGKLASGATYDLTLGTDYQYLQTGGALNPIFTTNSRLLVTQPLLRGAGQAYQCAPIAEARNVRLQSKEIYRESTLAKIREVEQAYFDLVAARENLAVRQRSLLVADQLVEINRVKVETGALPPIEMTSAESARAFRRSELVTSEAEVLTTADRLRREIFSFESKSDWTVVIEPTDDIEERSIDLLPLDSIVAIAMRAEPRVLRARLEVGRVQRELEQRCSERKPELNAIGSVEFVALEQDGYQSYADLYNRGRDALSVTAGLALQYPLGNRFASARVAEAQLQVTKACVELRNLQIDVDSQVRNALRNLDVASRAIRARRDAVHLADQQVDVERAKFEVQASTNFQVFEVEDQRNQRRIELVRALILHRLAILDLPRVTGAPLTDLLAHAPESRRP